MSFVSEQVLIEARGAHAGVYQESSSVFPDETIDMVAVTVDMIAYPDILISRLEGYIFSYMV